MISYIFRTSPFLELNENSSSKIYFQKKHLTSASPVWLLLIVTYQYTPLLVWRKEVLVSAMQSCGSSQFKSDSSLVINDIRTSATSAVGQVNALELMSKFFKNNK